jgi:hypothetical protein
MTAGRRQVSPTYIGFPLSVRHERRAPARASLSARLRCRDTAGLDGRHGVSTPPVRRVVVVFGDPGDHDGHPGFSLVAGCGGRAGNTELARISGCPLSVSRRRRVVMPTRQTGGGRQTLRTEPEGDQSWT